MSKLNREEEVWLRALCASIQSKQPLIPTKYADSALKEFKKRFPFKSKKLKQRDAKVANEQQKPQILQRADRKET